MQLNLAFLCLMAYSLPTTTAQRTEANAVTIKTFPNNIGCGFGISGHTYSFPDGECFHLSGDFINVERITDTCRVFIYSSNDCSTSSTQWERPLSTYDRQCRNIKRWFSIKAFCH